MFVKQSYGLLRNEQTKGPCEFELRDKHTRLDKKRPHFLPGLLLSFAAPNEPRLPRSDSSSSSSSSRPEKEARVHKEDRLTLTGRILVGGFITRCDFFFFFSLSLDRNSTDWFLSVSLKQKKNLVADIFKVLMNFLDKTRGRGCKKRSCRRIWE